MIIVLDVQLDVNVCVTERCTTHFEKLCTCETKSTCTHICTGISHMLSIFFVNDVLWDYLHKFFIQQMTSEKSRKRWNRSKYERASVFEAMKFV